MLLSSAEKTGSSVLRHLDPKRIMAYGLSAAAITAAVKLSNGAVETMKHSPGLATVWLWGLAAVIGGILLLLYLAPKLLRDGIAVLFARRKNCDKP